MPSEAFHKSAHFSLSHSTCHHIPFKHTPQCPDEGSYISWDMPLTLASEASVYFLVWPGCPSLDLALRIQLDHQSITLGWDTVHCDGLSQCLSQSTPASKHTSHPISSSSVGLQHRQEVTSIPVASSYWCLQWLAQDETGNSPQYVATEWMNQLKSTESVKSSLIHSGRSSSSSK